MTDESRIQILARAAALGGVLLSESQLELLDRYCRELAMWNEKMNLLSRSSFADTLLKNVIDSLMAVRFLPGPHASLLDMGSGGGFPGIPLKIADDSLNVSLLESSRKKASFLKHAIRVLQLGTAKVIHDRAENLQGNEAYKKAFTVVISKAAFKLPQLLTLGAYFLAAEGVLIAMKGGDIGEEMKEAEGAATGLVLSASHSLTLPITGERRTFLIYARQNR